MAAEVLKHPNFADFGTDDFFEVALEEGFTKQGEMFWAEDLSRLAEMVLNCHSKVIYGNINDNWPIIAQHLMQGKRVHYTVSSGNYFSLFLRGSQYFTVGKRQLYNSPQTSNFVH